MSAPTLSPEVQELLKSQHVLRLGDTAPDFTAESQLGPIHLYDYLGSSWGILFSHPQDFTPVCTSELGRVAQLKEEFAKRDTKVLALSVDTIEHHHSWIADINELHHCDVQFPLLADTDRRVSVLYGMLDQTHLHKSGMPFTVRNVFILDPSKVVRLIISYPAPTGRSFDELLRVLDSLQLAVSHKVATPADWQRGKDTVVLPTVPTEEAHKLFPKGVNVIRPWLRTTPDPSV